MITPIALPPRGPATGSPGGPRTRARPALLLRPGGRELPMSKQLSRRRFRAARAAGLVGLRPRHAADRGGASGTGSGRGRIRLRLGEYVWGATTVYTYEGGPLRW